MVHIFQYPDIIVREHGWWPRNLASWCSSAILSISFGDALLICVSLEKLHLVKPEFWSMMLRANMTGNGRGNGRYGAICFRLWNSLHIYITQQPVIAHNVILRLTCYPSKWFEKTYPLNCQRPFDKAVSLTWTVNYASSITKEIWCGIWRISTPAK